MIDPTNEDAILNAKQRELEERRARERAANPPQQPAMSALQREIEAMRLVAEAQAERETATQKARAERTALAAEEARQRAIRPEALATWLTSIGVRKRHRLIDFDLDLLPHAFVEWASGFPGSLEGASAILAGLPGAGKTSATIWALTQIYRSGSIVEGRWVCPTARFVSAADVFASVFRQDKDPHAAALLETCNAVSVLVIDDVGVPYETEWPLAAFDQLIYRRDADMKTTIVTTNLWPSIADDEKNSFEKRYPRVWSRLRDAAGPGLVVMAGDDLRSKPESHDAHA